MNETLIFIIRLLIAGICGCAIGYERSNRNKEAGIRTHSIVAIASALMMIISKYGFSDIKQFDASRIASQVVSGVGFLGAGIIFVRNNNVVSGLTTSAGIWATSGVGMAIGAGLLPLGVITTCVLLIMQIILHKNLIIPIKEDVKYVIFIKIKDELKGFNKMKNIILQQNINIDNVNITKVKECFEIEIDITADKEFNKLVLLEKLTVFDRIVYLKII